MSLTVVNLAHIYHADRTFILQCARFDCTTAIQFVATLYDARAV